MDKKVIEDKVIQREIAESTFLYFLVNRLWWGGVFVGAFGAISAWSFYEDHRAFLDGPVSQVRRPEIS